MGSIPGTGATGVGATGAGARGTDRTGTPPRSRFVEITASAGIDFVHFSDASEDRFLPETMGAGAAFLDYDRDGLPDLYLVNGAPLTQKLRTSAEPAPAPTGRLYRNLGGGRFEDVTAGSGLDVSFYGMGVAVGDYDNDGWIDLVVTAVGRDYVFRNRGDGTFQDVTTALGFGPTGFTTSAAFLDYDRDGLLDLFLCRYVEWTPESDIECRPDGVHRIYCTPESYPPVSNLLFRNLGDRFVDVTEESGIGAVLGKGLGVVPIDHDGDGWPDLVVANDTVRNFLFRNRGDGSFEEIGAEVGVAYSESGAPRGGMGIDSGDLDGDGHADVVVTNFAHEMVALFRATGRGNYLDDAAHLGLGFPTLPTLGFGVLIEDLDGDGFLDVAIVNGHIEPGIAAIQRSQTYAQLPQIFYGGPSGMLDPDGGDGWVDTPLVGRGLASADIDGDGDLDLLFTQNGGAVRLFRNDSPPHHWIRIVPDSGVRPDSPTPLGATDAGGVGPGAASPGALNPGALSPGAASPNSEHPGGEVPRVSGGAGGATASGSPAWGAQITVHTAGRVWSRRMVSGRSYLSASEPGVHFGLGAASRVDSLVIDWPSGARETLVDPPVDQVTTVHAPR